MPIKNETLRKKLESKRDFLVQKIEPLQEEFDLVSGMLGQLDAHENHKLDSAQETLGLNEEEAA
jgi:hypothetical protein